MPIAKIRSMRGRLLFLLALVIIPVALFNQGLTLLTYWSSVDDIHVAQRDIARNYAMAVRRNIQNSASLLISVALRLQTRDGTCGELVQQALIGHEELLAVVARSSAGVTCSALRDPGADVAQLEKVLPQSATPTPVGVQAPTLLTTFDAANVNGAVLTVLHVNTTAVAVESWSVHALVKASAFMHDPAAGAIPAGKFALLKAGQMLATNHGEDASWIPVGAPELAKSDVWQVKASDGSVQNYAAAPVAQPDLFVIADLDNDARTDAWRRYLGLSLAPLAFMVFLVMLYTRAIQRDVVASAEQINTFAALPIAHGETFAIDPSMPDELKGVFNALYNLKTQAATREAALTASSERNHALTLELHHRVKNSLQVIQSYISLGRREMAGKNRLVLAQTEARVQVIATGYRLALRETGLNSVPVRLFATQVTNNIFATLRHKHQWVTTLLDVEGDMQIDRLIPLGLAMVEVLSDALSHDEIDKFSVNLTPAGSGVVDFTITMESETRPHSRVSARMLDGLASQLEAQRQDLQHNELLHWRFSVDD